MEPKTHLPAGQNPPCQRPLGLLLLFGPIQAHEPPGMAPSVILTMTRVSSQQVLRRMG
jgi:hypothetical protein